MLKARDEVAVEDTWNVEALYPTREAWERDFKEMDRQKTEPRWPELLSYKGRLGKDAKTLKEALELTLSLDRKLTKLYIYAHLRHDEDVANDLHKAAYGRILALSHDFRQEISWMDPEILSIPQNVVDGLLASPELSEFRFYLEKIIRAKPHTLSADQEELVALAGSALDAPHKAFSALDNADFKFGTVCDGSGKEKELTHGLYKLYLLDQDRVLRENAFKKLHRKYQGYENTLCELISGQVQSHRFQAKARKYISCLDAALFPKDVDVSVYRNLISTVRANIAPLHRYVRLRKKALNLPELHLYDMYVPLTKSVDIKMSYREAEEVVIESVAPLGSEYQNYLKKGMQQERWVDRYENKNKRSGAYSSGCFDSMPYILMNYRDMLRDVFTLAHEAGHSMHSLMSRKNQPYQYADYPIFVAEVASTFNEELLMVLLLQRAKSDEEKRYLVDQKVEDIRATLFRQTMFAEFELLVHELVEKGESLTPSLLKAEYRKLNQAYFGPDVVVDEEIDIEWARIPHFYYNFYVYQYATGISAALALSERVLNGGAKEREDYLSFLKGGCRRYPIDLLRTAGVDMSSPEPIKQAINKFSALLDRLE